MTIRLAVVCAVFWSLCWWAGSRLGENEYAESVALLQQLEKK